MRYIHRAFFCIGRGKSDLKDRTGRWSGGPTEVGTIASVLIDVGVMDAKVVAPRREARLERECRDLIIAGILSTKRQWRIGDEVIQPRRSLAGTPPPRSRLQVAARPHRFDGRNDLLPAALTLNAASVMHNQGALTA